MRIFRYAACIAVLVVLSHIGQLSAQNPRSLIEACYRSGAINTFLMQQCSGIIVDTPSFHACMQGGPCFGAPPVQANIPVIGPGTLCGAMGLPFCPAPAQCGRPGTVYCPGGFAPFGAPMAPACGAPPFPPCMSPQQCGLPHTYPCPTTQALPAPNFAPDLRPSMFVRRLPPDVHSNGGAAPTMSIRFAQGAIPSESRLRSCLNEAGSQRRFEECVVRQALPPAYRQTARCADRHSSDFAAVAACSAGRDDLQDEIRQFREVQACVERGRASNSEVAACMATPFLGQEERRAVRCLAENRGDAAAAIICHLSPDLTPEQQIAISCAVRTGGQPHAFVGCTGGQLMQREVSKCFEHGIATERGCFGPNNEIRRYLGRQDDFMRTTLGGNSVAYQAYSAWHNNVLAPGPNHDLVRTFNNALSDVRNGPGPNNEVVRAANGVGDAVRSIGRAFGF
jgi:hypothetical protein